MESLTPHFLFHQWQRKLMAIFTATVIWFFVSHSIISTKTIPSVPVKIINLPTDKTIRGLLPNGFLSKRSTLTLTGTKDVIDQLEPGDIEVILDVSNLSNDGIVQFSKKDLISLNPNINLVKHITSVSHPEFVIKLSSLLTEKIPVMINSPIGNAPEGYEFIDYWPMTLIQTVTGPQDEVLQLKNKGLQLTFNLGEIGANELDILTNDSLYADEVNFLVPEEWKKVPIPFSSRGTEFLNDAESKFLHLTFLKKKMVPVGAELPIHIFYPLKYSATINPNTYALIETPFVKVKNQIPVLTYPLFANNVSELFMEIVRENMELDIVAVPATEREKLEWSVGFIDDSHLEDTFVAFLMSDTKNLVPVQGTQASFRELHYRRRFRNYMQKLSLNVSTKHILELDCYLNDNHILIEIPFINPSVHLKTK